MANVESVSTVEAARVLGVMVQHVRRLVDSGNLIRIARGLIDRDSLDRYLAERHGGRTRVWAQPTAWGAIAVLSGMHADWLGSPQASRVRAWLRAVTDPVDLVVQTRDRARVYTFLGHPAGLQRLADDLVSTDARVLGLVETRPDSVDGYLAEDRLGGITSFYGLAATPSGNVTIRATSFDLDDIRDIAIRSDVLAALDAAISTDPRARGIGERALADAVDLRASAQGIPMVGWGRHT